jgi:uncharacterized surface protein with fasciclin (FAS1) repeats
MRQEEFEMQRLIHGDAWMLEDEKGGKATITIPNVYQSNGVIHVISAVVMPS